MQRQLGGGGDNPGDHQNKRRPGEEAAPGRQNQQHPPSQTCPRCNSNNTKFCYYNNYSLSQPRYFCKGCRRYWTHGGTLRNVPVGGGSRKSKRPKVSSSSATTSHHSPPPPPPPPPAPPQQQQNDQQQLHQMMTNNDNNNPFYSGGSFLSSLVTQPLSFGPNLGLLHGLTGFDLRRPPPPPQQPDPPPFEPPILQHRQSIYPAAAASASADWSLSIQPGPTGSNQWPDFPAGSGLDDP